MMALVGFLVWLVSNKGNKQPKNERECNTCVIMT